VRNRPQIVINLPQLPQPPQIRPPQIQPQHVVAVVVVAIAIAELCKNRPPPPPPPPPIQQRRTCAQTHPELVECNELGAEYIHLTQDLACRAGWQGTRAVNPQPSDRGRCIGKGGMHYRCQAGGVFRGTASCCPCCEDTPAGPVVQRWCRNHA
jgi:hypothetical protein